MKILALDTATEGCSVSLGIGNRSIDRYVELERGHAEHLLPMVDSVLAEGGIALSALDAIAFGRGPGGFTGVRLAASVAQGLAFGAQVGVVPISVLAEVAQRVVQLNSSDAIHIFIGCQLVGAWIGVKHRLLDVLRRTKSAIYLHHPSNRQPGHRDGF